MADATFHISIRRDGFLGTVTRPGTVPGAPYRGMPFCFGRGATYTVHDFWWCADSNLWCCIALDTDSPGRVEQIIARLTQEGWVQRVPIAEVREPYTPVNRISWGSPN